MKKGRLIIASSRDSADIFYASGFSAPDPYIYFSSGKIKGIVVSAMEYARAQREVKNGIRVYERNEFFPAQCAAEKRNKKGYPKTASSRETERREILSAIIKRFPAEIWDIPANFPFSLGDYLRRSGIRLACVEGTFFSKRRRKTKSEIRKIIFALRVTESAMGRAVEILRSSVVDKMSRLLWNGQLLSSEILRQEIEIEIIKGGGVAQGTIVSCGRKSAEPHNSGSGLLFANKPIIIDIFPRIESSGYYGDLTRTFVKGKVPAVVKKAFEAVREARDDSKKMIRAGIFSAKIYRHAFEVLEKLGFQTGKKDDVNFGFFHGLGHGVGLDIHELPDISSRISQALVENDVITVEPGLYYPEWGGVRLEDMVVVGKRACKTITRYPTFLQID